MVMDIRYGASCKINIFGRKIEFFILSPIKFCVILGKSLDYSAKFNKICINYNFLPF